MKKFIQLLLKKRFKILKSKRGFSLIEVLVAVAIIGIISAIAVPQFTANRNEAARVAGDTSISNIIKAFNNCRVLNGFTSCDSLSELKVTCPDCQDSQTTNKFCAYILKGKDPGSPDFTACVSVDESSGSQVINRTYGGTLLQNVCKFDVAPSAGTVNCSPTGTQQTSSPLKTCSSDNDCTNVGSSVATGTGTCVISNRKCLPTTNTGKCDATASCL